jgi:iron complex outermembrane receptor protein
MLLTEMYDTGRVEVLKGPQGDLYGRNATGGAINILSQEPKAGFGAEGFVGAGSFGLKRAHGAVNVGNEVVAIRVSGAISKDHGYTKNLTNNDDMDSLDFKSFRTEIKITPADGVTANAFWHSAVDKTNIGYTLSADPTFGLIASQFGYIGLAGPANIRVSPRTVRIDQPLDVDRTGDIAGLTVAADLGAVTVKSITGYTRYRNRDSYDSDGTSAAIEYQATRQFYRSFSQELQLIRSNGKILDWVLGAYYYRDRGTEFTDNPFNNNIGTVNPTIVYASSITDARVRGKSTALYGQGTAHLLSNLDIVIGGRYTRDEKIGFSTRRGRVNVDQSVKFSKFTPSGQIVWKIDPSFMLYGTVSAGFKSGGLNFSDNSGTPAFRPENVTAYEVGLKSRPFGTGSILNLSGFYYDYRDIQLRTSFFTGSPPVARIAVTNASSAKVWGVELNGDNRISGPLSVDVNLAYLHTSVSGYTSPTNGSVLDGRALPMSPKWSGNIGLKLELPVADVGRLRVRGEYAFRTKIIFPFSYDADINTITDGYSGVINATARFTLDGDKLYFEVIGRNLNNDLYRTFRANFPPFVRYDGYGPSRSIEGRIGFKF